MEDAQSVDLDDDFMLAVPCVEVRRSMIALVHADHDAEELTDDGHRRLPRDLAGDGHSVTLRAGRPVAGSHGLHARATSFEPTPPSAA